MSVAVKISLLTFVAVAALARGIFALLQKDRDDIAKRMMAYTGNRQEDSREKEEKKRGMSILLLAMAPKKMLAAAEKELMQADIPLKPEELVLFQVLAALVPAVVGAGLLKNVPLAVIGSMLGVVLPLFYSKHAKQKRLKKFNEQLGEALPLMSSSLRAGFSLLQTIDILQKETAPPLSVEMGRALREMKLGTSTEEALSNMTKRVGSDDLELIVTAVGIQRAVGGNLAEVLDNISSTIRERVRIKGEVKTLTAQGRISGTIVGLLPLILAAFIFVTNPDYVMVMVRHPLGIAMLVGAVISEAIGAFLIKRIVNIEY